MAVGDKYNQEEQARVKGSARHSGELLKCALWTEVPESVVEHRKSNERLELNVYVRKLKLTADPARSLSLLLSADAVMCTWFLFLFQCLAPASGNMLCCF